MNKDNDTGLYNIAIGHNTNREPMTPLEWVRVAGAAVVFVGVVMSFAHLCVTYDIRF